METCLVEWICPLGAAHGRALVEDAVADGWRPGPSAPEIRIGDARWCLGEACPLEHTRAMLHAGVAAEVLTRDLNLAWWPGMQDWPLEISDEARVEEFCAYQVAAPARADES